MEIRRSIWAEMTFLKILFCWLIIPVVVAVVVAKSYTVTITDKKIIVKSGVFNKRTSEYAVAGITSMTVNQPFFGGIFKYGTLAISLAGNRSVYLENIVDPQSAKSFLNKKLEKTADAEHILTN